MEFKTPFALTIFKQKYAIRKDETWKDLAHRVVNDVCGDRKGTTDPLLSPADLNAIESFIATMKFIPGGRYLYYAGRDVSFYNNCFLMRATDTREGWAELVSNATLALMSGGGIGVDYSALRPAGSKLIRSGGESSGPLPLMKILNEVGRNVMQGGSRRSAMYASLSWRHKDIHEFMYAKNWTSVVRALKEADFNFPATLDMTNISINWDDLFMSKVKQGKTPPIWYESIRRMCKTGEPGHSYNFKFDGKETLRNACAEVTSEDDSDVCNLGSINMANVDNLDEMKRIVDLSTKFLVCGSIRGDLPYEKVEETREKNRRLGLGLMGIHEWLLARGYGYEVVHELETWLQEYKDISESSANSFCDELHISRPVKYRAIAPTGTIGIMASTTTGIEPLFAVAYKRRYLQDGTMWKYQYVIDATAESLINKYDLNPKEIETAYTLALNPEKRIKFQYNIQRYVDHAISSTLNLPAWGTEHNNEETAVDLANTLLKYYHGLRGMTVYPDGARGGQPLTPVDYNVAKQYKGVIFDEVEEKCSGGICGL